MPTIDDLILEYLGAVPQRLIRSGLGPTVYDMVAALPYGRSAIRIHLAALIERGLARSEKPYPNHSARHYITDAGLDRLAELEREGAA